MKKMIFSVLLLLLIFIYYVLSSPKPNNANPQIASVLNEEEVHQISLGLANLFWKQLAQFGPFYDFDEVLENLKDLESGKKKPFPKKESQEQMLSLIDKISTYQSRLNLKASEDYLEKAAKQENIVEVIPNKLYYELLSPGQPLLSDSNLFKIHLIESKLCDGEEVLMQNTRLSNSPITLALSDTILGFAKGASGMAPGERRKIYIHPELSYGKHGRHGFQQLIICDVERL